MLLASASYPSKHSTSDYIICRIAKLYRKILSNRLFSFGFYHIVTSMSALHNVNRSCEVITPAFFSSANRRISLKIKSNLTRIEACILYLTTRLKASISINSKNNQHIMRMARANALNFTSLKIKFIHSLQYTPYSRN
jgi:hypothetical protein